MFYFDLDLKYLIFNLWKLGHFSLAWSELCVFQNIRTKKAKETSLYNPGSGKILEKWHQDLKTRRIDFTTDLRIPTVTHKTATKSGTVITSFISVQSLKAGYLRWVMLAGPSFFLTVLKWMTHRKSWWSCYNC